jgi:hypothetical protein
MDSGIFGSVGQKGFSNPAVGIKGLMFLMLLVFSTASFMGAALACGEPGNECPPQNTPPVISEIPDFTIDIGETIQQFALENYAYDGQDSFCDLNFMIVSQTNMGMIDCYLTISPEGNRIVTCSNANSAGYSDVTVRVTDAGGLSDTDTFRITVNQQPPQNHAPAINSVSITPSNPKDSDGLTCSVDVSDQDGNLERVQFRWLVDGGLQKTRNVYVSGSWGNVQDTLGSTVSSIGDSVRCEATVYDTQGMQDIESDTVMIEMQSCGADVYSLQVVDNSKIMFSIRNTGGTTESMNYVLYVDGSVIHQSSMALSSGEWDIIQKDYYFGTGSFVVKAKVTADCGDTDSETLFHVVQEPVQSRPSVDYVRITPFDPEEYDDLTCRVEASDKNMDLDRIRFRWLVDGYLQKTRTLYANGGSDSAEDTLSYGFSRGDSVECEATVYDKAGDTDTDRDSVSIGGTDGNCGVDVYSLRAYGNEITFDVRNTGDDDQTINYEIYVENEKVRDNSIYLDSGQRRTIQESFWFGSGDDYLVKVKVISDCGSTDWESVYHQPSGMCTARYLDEYRCFGLWSQRRYQNSDCSYVWVNMESCPSGCYSGYCSGGGQCTARYLDEYRCSGLWSQRRYQNSDCSYTWVNMESCPNGCYSGYCSGITPSGVCRLSIQRFDYQSNVIEGGSASASVDVRNTGTRQETITLKLLVDGQEKGSFSESLSPNAVSARTFYYYPSAGSHSIVIKAEADCGVSEQRTASIYVQQQGAIQPPYVPVPQPLPSLPTAVSIYPTSIDTDFCTSKFVTIDVHNSKQQVYTIQVTGVPSDWVSYQSQNIVDAGDRKLYVYAGPKEPGMRKMLITVKAETENLLYSQEVSVYTTDRACPSGSGAAGGDGITAFLTESAKSSLFWVLLVILLAVIIIVYGTVRLRHDVEYYDPYDPRYNPYAHKKER